MSSESFERRLQCPQKYSLSTILASLGFLLLLVPFLSKSRRLRRLSIWVSKNKEKKSTRVHWVTFLTTHTHRYKGGALLTTSITRSSILAGSRAVFFLRLRFDWVSWRFIHLVCPSLDTIYGYVMVCVKILVFTECHNADSFVTRWRFIHLVHPFSTLQPSSKTVCVKISPPSIAKHCQICL